MAELAPDVCQGLRWCPVSWRRMQMSLAVKIIMISRQSSYRPMCGDHRVSSQLGALHSRSARSALDCLALSVFKANRETKLT